MNDICATNHGGNRESADAFGDGKDVQRERVFDAILASGEQGVSCDELATLWGVGQNSISGRFSELRRDGQIEKKGRRKTRTGSMAAVYVVCA